MLGIGLSVLEIGKLGIEIGALLIGIGRIGATGRDIIGLGAGKLGKTLGIAGSTILPMFGISMDSASCIVVGSKFGNPG